MIAFITQRESRDNHGTSIDILESRYINYFESLGLELKILSNFHTNIKELLNQSVFDLVILTGGGSVPSIAVHEEKQTNRDFIEKLLVEEANKREIPIIAICRGMQYVNSLFGGKVVYLEELNTPRNIKEDHTVLMMNGDTMKVNNFHNHGIKVDHLAKGFEIVAIDNKNNIVEAYYSKSNKILGIQWHPEREFEEIMSGIITKNMIKNFLDNKGELDESYYFSSRTRN